jgi:DNA helicase HerA-like ATPase
LNFPKKQVYRKEGLYKYWKVFAQMSNILKKSLVKKPTSIVQKVPIKININKIYSRHLAILAMTGMGKSNLVSLPAREISKTQNTMVMFDYHGFLIAWTS